MNDAVTFTNGTMPTITNTGSVTVTEYSEFIPLPPKLLNTPIAEWQLDGVTIAVALMILGRIWKAWKDGGGLRGMWKAFYGGSSATDAQDMQKQKPGTDAQNSGS